MRPNSRIVHIVLTPVKAQDADAIDVQLELNGAFTDANGQPTPMPTSASLDALIDALRIITQSSCPQEPTPKVQVAKDVGIPNLRVN